MKQAIPLLFALLATLLLSCMPSLALESSPAQDGVPSSVEERRILSQLQETRRELEARAAELDKREVELNSLQAEVDKKIDELRQVREEVQTLMQKQAEEEERRQQEEAARLAKREEERNAAEAEQAATLAKMYEKMDPAKAASIVVDLKTSLAIGILGGMKSKSAGRILAAMEGPRAVELTTAFAEQNNP